MKKISQKILNSILNLKIDSIAKAVEYFNRNRDLFLPDSQEKIMAILEEPKKKEEQALLYKIINHDFHRPALLIQDGNFKVPKENPWSEILKQHKRKLLKALPSVGIFEIQKNSKKLPSGTGWVLSDDLIVTNQHVAHVFSKKVGNKYVFRSGIEKITIDFKEEFDRVNDHEFKILEVVHCEEEDTNLYDHCPDIAILRVEKINDQGAHLPPPLKIYPDKMYQHQLIAIIGFPSADYKLPTNRKKIFKNIYDVKRLQPGVVIAQKTIYDFDFKHDCATLTGNSGSPIIDILTGKVLGTHFAGSLNVFEGYGVRNDVIFDILNKKLF